MNKKIEQYKDVKLIYKFNAVSIKISVAFFNGIRQNIKLIWKSKGPRREDKEGGGGGRKGGRS
jgi:hypothetical protein